MITVPCLYMRRSREQAAAYSANLAVASHWCAPALRSWVVRASNNRVGKPQEVSRLLAAQRPGQVCAGTESQTLLRKRPYADRYPGNRCGSAATDGRGRDPLLMAKADHSRCLNDQIEDLSGKWLLSQARWTALTLRDLASLYLLPVGRGIGVAVQ